MKLWCFQTCGLLLLQQENPGYSPEKISWLGFPSVLPELVWKNEFRFFGFSSVWEIFGSFYKTNVLKIRFFLSPWGFSEKSQFFTWKGGLFVKKKNSKSLTKIIFQKTLPQKKNFLSQFFLKNIPNFLQLFKKIDA